MTWTSAGTRPKEGDRQSARDQDWGKQYRRVLRKARKVDITSPELSNGVCLLALLGDEIRDVSTLR